MASSIIKSELEQAFNNARHSSDPEARLNTSIRDILDKFVGLDMLDSYISSVIPLTCNLFSVSIVVYWPDKTDSHWLYEITTDVVDDVGTRFDRAMKGV